jgi:hypothetical protein
MPIVNFTEQELALLREMAHRFQQNVGDPLRRSSIDDYSHQAPEVYVAYPIDSYETGTGTDEDATLPALTAAPGTADDDYAVPGMAKCRIYKVVEETFGSPELQPVGSSSSKDDYYHWVYNVSTTALANKYFPVIRDKFGTWLPVGGGGGGGAAFITFQVISMGPFYDDTSVECNTVLAEVLSVSCDSSVVSVGDIITVWDPLGCWFSIPIENIENAYGHGMQMAQGVNFDMAECSASAATESCFWMVTYLCCLEQVTGT